MQAIISVFLIRKPFGFRGVGEVVRFDSKADILFYDEEFALTWRRYGQEFPAKSEVVDHIMSFNSDDDQWMVANALAHNITVQYPTFDHDIVFQACMRLVGRIKMARQTGDRWQYTHSAEYFADIHQIQFEEPVSSDNIEPMLVES